MEYRVEPGYDGLLSRAGITNAESVWSSAAIQIWRSISERENGTIDTTRDDGTPIRFHVKRDKARVRSPAADEARGMAVLRGLRIPTATLVARGRRADGATFVITEHLTAHAAADKLISNGLSFKQLIEPTAAITGRLHAAGAFHRDLYLCHFFATADARDVRLIDCARVLHKPFWRRRWQVKDLSQFVYSARACAVAPSELDAWFLAYGQALGRSFDRGLRRAIDRKVETIARHDARLRRRQPTRNVSIPT